MHNHFRFPKTKARHNFIYVKVRLNHRSIESQERLVSIWIDNTVNVPSCSHQNAKCICKMGPPPLFPLDFCVICANCWIKEINTTHSTIIYFDQVWSCHRDLFFFHSLKIVQPYLKGKGRCNLTMLLQHYCHSIVHNAAQQHHHTCS